MEGRYWLQTSEVLWVFIQSMENPQESGTIQSWCFQATRLSLCLAKNIETWAWILAYNWILLHFIVSVPGSPVQSLVGQLSAKQGSGIVQGTAPAQDCSQLSSSVFCKKSLCCITGNCGWKTVNAPLKIGCLWCVFMTLPLKAYLL